VVSGLIFSNIYIFSSITDYAWNVEGKSVQLAIDGLTLNKRLEKHFLSFGI
jgi:hypothetical protein